MNVSKNKLKAAAHNNYGQTEGNVFNEITEAGDEYIKCNNLCKSDQENKNLKSITGRSCSPISIIDSHAHLYDYVKNETIFDILQRAKVANINHIITIGTNINDSIFYSNFTKNYQNIDYTIGIHPSYAQANNNIKDIEEILLNASKKPVAIGEIGLDYYSQNVVDKVNKKEQQDLFCKQLELAKQYNLKIVIHSRDAFDDTISSIKNSLIDTNNFIFHCFTYEEYKIKQLTELNIYVSFSGIVTYKNAQSVRNAFAIAPRTNILIETDCPFLAPMPYRGRQNEPAFLREIEKFLAKEINLTEEEFSLLTYSNTNKAFNLQLPICGN